MYKKTKQPIAIIAAMEPEWCLLKSSLQNTQKLERFGQQYLFGELCGRNVVLALSGIGKVNAAIATTCLIELFKPLAVINTGSAGGLGKGIHVGDVVVSLEVAHHDVDVTAFGHEIGQVPQLPAVFSANQTLINAAERAAVGFDGAQLHHGAIVSGDQFVNTKEKIQAIRKAFPDVMACEMEAAAVAQVCYRAGVPFVVIRAISDHADEEAENSFDVFINQAGRCSAEMVKSIVKDLPESF